MLDRIASLEAMAKTLEPDAEARHDALSAAERYADRFLDHLPTLPGYVPDDEAARAALEAPLGEDPIDIESVLGTLWEGVDRLGVNESAGHFFGFIPGASLVTSAVGDYLAAITNRYAGITYGAPGATRLQSALLRWYGEMIGYPETSAGDLTSGGSIANLTAIVSARESAGLRSRDIEHAVVYLTAQTHHSVDKALRIAGLGEAAVRHIPLDDRFRMRPDALAATVRSDAAVGLRPWLVVASAGTTDTGAVDPLNELADISEEHGLHLHVDAAYGGGFALCDEGREALAGIERSDSMIMDPHKALFIPFGTGLVLVKDRAAMLRAHHYDASYMQDTAGNDELLSPGDVSPELTRHNRVVRLWLPLRLHGVRAFRAAVEEKMLLARYFHERMEALDEFEVGPTPDLSVVTFRFIPPHGDIDDANRELVRSVQADGRIYISSTTIEGQVTLRLAVLSVRSHRVQVDLAIDVLTELAGTIA